MDGPFKTEINNIGFTFKSSVLIYINGQQYSLLSASSGNLVQADFGDCGCLDLFYFWVIATVQARMEEEPSDLQEVVISAICNKHSFSFPIELLV